MPVERIFRVDYYPNIPDNRNLQIKNISDVHKGAKTHLRKPWKETIKTIKKTRYCKAILTGDIIENNTRDSVGEGVYEQELTPDEQLLQIVDDLEPIRNKLLGIKRGNHEKRTSRSQGVDVVNLLAKYLEIPRLQDHSLFTFHFDDVERTILFTHGKSGASTMAGKVRALENLVQIYSADIYLMGHVHQLLTWRNIIYGKDGYKLRHFGINGSFMDYLDSYAQEGEYRPGIPGYISAMVGHNDVHLNENDLIEYMSHGNHTVIDERPKKVKA